MWLWGDKASLIPLQAAVPPVPEQGPGPSGGGQPFKVSLEGVVGSNWDQE